MLWVIYNKSVKDYEHKLYFQHQESEEEFFERQRLILDSERNLKGITLGYKNPDTELMIEVPLGKDCNFMILSNTLMISTGDLIYQRRVFETVGGR